MWGYVGRKQKENTALPVLSCVILSVQCILWCSDRMIFISCLPRTVLLSFAVLVSVAYLAYQY